jgi:capsule polysaccharide modification protein KpsS
LTVSAANIHDILAAAARVVTINSAVGVEAYLHRKPVILCGQADFHHIADVARSVDALADLLSRDPKPRAYAKYIHWYFAQMCLSTTEPDLTGRFLDRVAAALE